LLIHLGVSLTASRRPRTARLREPPDASAASPVRKIAIVACLDQALISEEQVIW